MRKDGTHFPAEASAVTSFDGTEFRGAQGTLRDISERERLERELSSSEERYRGLVQSSPDLIFEMDGNGVYTFYSDRTEEVIGWSPGEMIGRPFTDFIDMAAFPHPEQRIAEIAANPGKPSTDRLLIRHKHGGRTIPFEVSVVGQVDELGQLAAIRGVARDISERERLENQLRASEERYRFLVENAPDVVFSADAQTRFLFFSDTIEQLTGFRPEELIGETFDKIITPETMPVALERWKLIEADPSLSQVLRIEVRHKDGGTVPLEIHSVGQTDGQGRFAGVHGSARDISERERLEAELRASEERYRSVIQSSPDLIWATNKAGRYEFVSDRVRDLLGWEPGEVLGRPFREFIDEQSVEMTNDNWARLALEPGITQTHRHRHPPQGRVAAAVRGVVRRGRPGRRGRGRVRHRARRGRARAPRARAARERGALPVPRRELARRHLRDGRGREDHLLLRVGGAGAGLGAAGGRGPALPGHRPHARTGSPPDAGSPSSPGVRRRSRPAWSCRTRTAPSASSR